jgi:heat shock protein 90kDa beta
LVSIGGLGVVVDMKACLQPVVDYLKETLEGRVSSVQVSARLTDSPCILVTSKMGWSANMQRLMKSQPMGDAKALEYMKGEKILEINPENPVRNPDISTVQIGAA